MTKYSIPTQWASVTREDLADFLYGSSYLDISPIESDQPNGTKSNKIILGFHGKESAVKGYLPPELILFGDGLSTEAFAWLRAFQPDICPLSQFARVSTISDFRIFTESKLDENIHYRDDLWSSIIVGEILAQGDWEGGPESLPISRTQACFSTSVAQATKYYRNLDVMAICFDRLQAAEADIRFVRRAVPVGRLLPIWNIAQKAKGTEVKPYEAVMGILKHLSGRLFTNVQQSLATVTAEFFGENGLKSNSIESRVIAFQGLSEIIADIDQDLDPDIIGAMLAGAAFLVGHGTSHEFLLKRVVRHSSSCPAWFGLMAALCGPSAWDANWSRITKSVERQIRVPFDWRDSSGFDLSWTEFAWYSGISSSRDVLIDLPKLTPRAVSIEIIPGACCQFRLANLGMQTDQDARVFDAIQRERDLTKVLLQFIKLAERGSAILGGSQMSISADTNTGRSTSESSSDKESSSKTKKPRATKRGV